MVSRHTHTNPTKGKVKEYFATKWIKQGASKRVRMVFLVALLSSSKTKMSFGGR